MTAEIEPQTVELFNICNASLIAGIKCAEQGQKPCEACQLFEECKKAKEALEELWKTKN
ncbi:MAG: hypothetical protein PHF29_10060 [Candidatus Riflebacteria bacterium]|nr:hypothetical protein [Candidatus Riflebacteria bacterium]